MKSLIIVALLFSSCFASSLYDQLSAGVSKTSKRADAITCQDANYQCVNVGGSCSAGCPDCVSALIDCQVNAENQTALCACATTFVNCYAAAKDATCDSSAYHDSCLAQLSNCSCGTPYTGALTGYSCYSNAYCTDNGKCASVKGVGSACNSSSECGDVNANPAWTYDYTCENNVCQKSSKNLPGDPCSSNSDCEFYSGYSLGCVSGKCASQAVDKECPTSGHQVYCGPNLYCDDSDTCQKVIAVGSFCDGNSTSSTLESMCGILASCDTQQNKCVKYLSLSKGQTCTFDGECGAGLYCSQNKSTCQDVLPEITCTSDDDCTKANPDYQGCSCQGTKAVCGVPGSQQCVDEALSLYTCIDNNNCPEEFIPGGCVENNCKKEYDCYYKCFSGVLADIYGTSCLANYVNTCDSPSFAARNVVAWGVVVLAAVAAML